MTKEAGSKDPLHGKTLEKILNELIVRYGWKYLGELIPIDCFLNKATINSSLRMLRKVSWARIKVEKLYIQTILEDRAKAAKPKPKPVPVKSVVPTPAVERKAIEVPAGLIAVSIGLRGQIKLLPMMDKPAVEAHLKEKLYQYFFSFKTGGTSVMVSEILNVLNSVDGVEKVETMNFFREDMPVKGPLPRNIQMDKLEIPVQGRMVLLLR